MQLNFLPAKRWMISLHNKLYHGSEKDFGVNWFCDASPSYMVDRWEVSLVGRIWDLGMPSFPSDRTKRITSWKTSYTTSFAIVISSLMSGTSRSALKTRKANHNVFHWRWISSPIRGVNDTISNPHGGCRMQTRSSKKRVLPAIGDSFKKIIVTADNIRLKRDESGITTIPVISFSRISTALTCKATISFQTTTVSLCRCF